MCGVSMLGGGGDMSTYVAYQYGMSLHVEVFLTSEHSSGCLLQRLLHVE